MVDRMREAPVPRKTLTPAVRPGRWRPFPARHHGPCSRAPAAGFEGLLLAVGCGVEIEAVGAHLHDAKQPPVMDV